MDVYSFWDWLMSVPMALADVGTFLVSSIPGTPFTPLGLLVGTGLITVITIHAVKLFV